MVASDGVDDAVLVERFRAGDEGALEALFQRYRRFAYAKGRSYYLAGGDADDLRQEALIGLYKAVRDFEQHHGAPFRSFAELCITRQLITSIKTATRKKHQPLNQYVSMSGSAGLGDEADCSYPVEYRDVADLDPEGHVIVNENVRELRRAMKDLLSVMEVEVLRLYVDGMSYDEISTELGHHGKAVSNALYRIKRKLHAHLESSSYAPALAAS